MVTVDQDMAVTRTVLVRVPPVAVRLLLGETMLSDRVVGFVSDVCPLAAGSVVIGTSLAARLPLVAEPVVGDRIMSDVRETLLEGPLDARISSEVTAVAAVRLPLLPVAVALRGRYTELKAALRV